MEIREAGIHDAPQLAPLLGQLGYPSEQDAVRGRLRRLSERPDCWTAVAVGDSEVLGLGSRLVLTSADHRHDAHAFYEHLGCDGTGRRLVKQLT